jgi:hypothetical protein
MIHIHAMVRALNILSFVSADERDSSYTAIYSSIEQYILQNCVHHKIYDLIDIHPETSKTICYCIHCNMTFPSP